MTVETDYQQNYYYYFLTISSILFGVSVVSLLLAAFLCYRCRKNIDTLKLEENRKRTETDKLDIMEDDDSTNVRDQIHRNYGLFTKYPVEEQKISGVRLY